MHYVYRTSLSIILWDHRRLSHTPSPPHATLLGDTTIATHRGCPTSLIHHVIAYMLVYTRRYLTKHVFGRSRNVGANTSASQPDDDATRLQQQWTAVNYSCFSICIPQHAAQYSHGRGTAGRSPTNLRSTRSAVALTRWAVRWRWILRLLCAELASCCAVSGCPLCRN